jgi:hypothetical protein
MKAYWPISLQRVCYSAARGDARLADGRRVERNRQVAWCGKEAPRRGPIAVGLDTVRQDVRPRLSPHKLPRPCGTGGLAQLRRLAGSRGVKCMSTSAEAGAHSCDGSRPAPGWSHLVLCRLNPTSPCTTLASASKIIKTCGQSPPLGRPGAVRRSRPRLLSAANEIADPSGDRCLITPVNLHLLHSSARRCRCSQDERRKCPHPRETNTMRGHTTAPLRRLSRLSAASQACCVAIS